MSVIDRNEPTETHNIEFLYNDGTNGIIHFNNWKNDIRHIKDYKKKIINNNVLAIHIPIFDNFYRKIFMSEGGFTFKRLIRCIVNACYEAGEYDTKNHPEHYNKINPEAEDFVDLFMLFNGSISMKDDDEIYVDLE